jgi:hypothetical protein
MALLWAAGIAAASLALALATRGPAVPDGAKGKPAPQQLLSAGDKAAPLRASAGAPCKPAPLRRPTPPLLLPLTPAAGAKASRSARRGFSSDAAVRALQAARALR